MLIYERPDTFATVAQRDGLSSVLASAATAYPGCCLLLLVVGLTPHWVAKVEQDEYKRGVNNFSKCVLLLRVTLHMAS